MNKEPLAKEQTMFKRPKLLFVQTQAENAGAQEISRLLGEAFEAKGYDVHHVFFYRKSDTYEVPPNTTLICEERPFSPLAFTGFLAKLVRHIKALEPDLVLTFQHYGNIFGAPAARLAGVKHVIANQVSAQATINPAVRMVDKILGSIGIYDAVTVNSADTAGEYANFPSRYIKRIIHVPHGFKDKTSRLNKAEARSKYNLPQEVPMLGSVARLNALKRLDVAVRALSHDANWHLVLGGHGPDEENLQSLAKDLGVSDRTHFIGELAPDEIGDLLAAMDVFVFPSVAETFGLAAVEAAQAGLPLVCNGLPVLREVLQTDLGPCSLFADTDNPESFVEPIRSLLEDKAKADALIRSSQELKKLYSMDAMVARYEDLIVSHLKPDSQIKDLAPA